MLLTIYTQDSENYAAHQGFTGEYYWKMKGGQCYKITGLTGDEDLDSVVDCVRGQIEQVNDYYRSYIIGYQLQEDGYLSEFERSQLEYEGVITYKEPELAWSDIVAEIMA